ncbi:MAG: DUF3429 domain-containing protein [Alphaproteobacteria bacterium]|nr:DUF3429 domain-containing protein [Alphaproteobacteria bacterium]MBU1527321.1 DUF3429 domain-containing protein [Alphaproteobacteria bacterium]MBU2117185.1 DUF3429 domain-containing protein [Alphaproteobacteria bacterium]MBU2352321.1 DUF3429 domain-containing protein [Alphaproteobacteria bacterium]MBU2383617.1 DUF3429 domain-containing protein [Alphaproteobacteria bacterium]
MNQPTRTAWTLALMGVIPFLGLGGSAAVGTMGIAPEAAREILSLYGAVIVAFMAGARWGAAGADERPSDRVLALSNVFPLAAWAALALAGVGSSVALGVLALCLLVQLAWDWPVSAPGYRRLRLTATAGAVAGLALGLI